MPRGASSEPSNEHGSTELRIPLAAERVRVGRRTRRTATVRVRTVVEERTAVVDPPLRRQAVHVSRRRVDRFVDRPPDVRREGNTLVVPIIEEVVTTRLKVVEEVRITLRRSLERRPQRIRLRRERAIVERFAADGR
jgi:stress response protein YsnF